MGSSFSENWDWAVSNIEWSLLVKGIGALVASFALTSTGRTAFGLLQSTRQLLWCSIGLFVAIFVLLIATDKSARSMPQIEGKIRAVFMPAGSPPPGQNYSHIFLLGMVKNSGSMQSAILNWSTSVDFDGDARTGRVEPIPSSTLAPLAMMNLPSHDSLTEETRTPIPAGGVTEGLLLVTFPNISQDMFIEREPTITVAFEDVMGRKTTLHFKGSPANRVTLPPLAPSGH
jgi:hypothetical protein